jgi:hypothetical protein
MSRACLVCVPPPFATTSRSGFSRPQCARMASAATTIVRFFVSLWCSTPGRRVHPGGNTRALFRIPARDASTETLAPTLPTKNRGTPGTDEPAQANRDVAQASGGLPLRCTRRVRRKDSSARSRLNSKLPKLWVSENLREQGIGHFSRGLPISVRPIAVVRKHQRSTFGSRTAVRDEDAASLWSWTPLPMAVASFEKRIEKTCRLRARNAPAQLSI